MLKLTYEIKFTVDIFIHHTVEYVQAHLHWLSSLYRVILNQFKTWLRLV